MFNGIKDFIDNVDMELTKKDFKIRHCNEQIVLLQNKLKETERMLRECAAELKLCNARLNYACNEIKEKEEENESLWRELQAAKHL